MNPNQTAAEMLEINKMILDLKADHDSYIKSPGNQSGQYDPLFMFEVLTNQLAVSKDLDRDTKTAYKKYLYVFFLIITGLCDKFNDAYPKKAPFYVMSRGWSSVDFNDKTFSACITADSIDGGCTITYRLPSDVANNDLDAIVNNMMTGRDYAWLLVSSVGGNKSIWLASLRTSLQEFISENYLKI